MIKKILIAGFGGQGILFAGKALAHASMLLDMEVSWFPSYGPEARGGTSYCSVIVSDAPIGSPIVSNPDILICMNGPSLDKFEGSAAPGGLIMTDNSLITRSVTRGDVKAVEIPATRLADENGLRGLANMVMIGRLLAETDLFEFGFFKGTVEDVVSEGKKNLVEANVRALEIGHEWKGVFA